MQHNKMLENINCVLAQQLQQQAGLSQQEAAEESQVIYQLMKKQGQCLLAAPRRGIPNELGDLQMMDELGVLHPKPPPQDSPARLQHLQSEMWRGAEALLLAPHTFEKLRQLPELQQIISFTAVKVVQKAGAPGWHRLLAQHAAVLLPPPGHASTADILQAMRQTPALQEYQKIIIHLFETLSPHMRLALAAEVAAGMLCPGSPTPRDTPEHAAALQMFIHTAAEEVERECEGLEHNQSTPSRVVAACGANSTLPGRQQKMAQHRSSSSSSSSSSDTMDCIPPSSSIRCWDLAPHTDLQLQVPPQQLLEHVLHLFKLCIQQQQQQPPSDTTQQPSTSNQDRHCDEDTNQHAASSTSPLQGILHPCLLEAAALMAQVLPAPAVQGPAAPPTAQQEAGALQQPLQQASTTSSSSLSSGNSSSSSSSSGPAVVSPPLHSTLRRKHTAKRRQQQQPQQHQPQGAPDDDFQEGRAAAVLAALMKGLNSSSGIDGKAMHDVTCLAAGCVLRFLQDQLSCWGADSAQWQQAVPLQALQLVSAVRQLEAAGQAAVAARAAVDRAEQSANASEAISSTAAAAVEDACSSSKALAVQAYQRVVHMLLSILQQLQHYRDCNGASSSSSSSSNSCLQNSGRGSGSDDNSCCCSSSAGSAGQSSGGSMLAPHTFFAADGPLSGQTGLQPGLGVGFWLDGTALTAGSTHSAAQARPTNSSNSSSSIRELELHTPVSWQAEAAWQALLAASKAHKAVSDVDQALLQRFLQADEPRALRIFRGELQAVAFTAFVQALEEQAPPQAEGFLFRMRQTQLFLQSKGCDVQLEALMHCCVEHKVSAVILHRMRQPELRWAGAGLAASTWGAYLQHSMLLGHWQGSAKADSATGAASGAEQDSDTNTQHAAPQDHHSSSEAELGWDQWGLIGSEPCAASHNAAGESSSSSGGSSSSSSPPCPPDDAIGLQDGCSSLRQLVVAAAESLSPFCASQLQLMRQGLELRCRASDCPTNKAFRAKARAAGAAADAPAAPTDSYPPPPPAPLSSHSSSDGAMPSSGNAGSSNGLKTGWPPGQHDWHPQCSFCQQEQSDTASQPGPHASSHQGAGGGYQPTGEPTTSTTTSSTSPNPSSSNSASSPSSSSSSSSSSTSCQWAVPYNDPFLWRRLLWRLLGKLSPEAQAFYATHLGMCPHSNVSKQWVLVCKSICGSLWSPQPVDLLALALSRPQQQHRRNMRRWERCVRQYSRALNSAFVQGYHPSTVLLSKQVLLALSPLHHQVLPPAEVAHFLPSSFGPAIGKALMQALCDVPVLDGFEHQHCPLQLWHVWWHVGLRVYQQLQQDKQQEAKEQGQDQQHGQEQKQQGSRSKAACSPTFGTSVSCNSRSSTLPATASSLDSTDSHCGCSSQPGCDSRSSNSTIAQGLDSRDDVEALYLNPDARLFAVGHATRQLSGLAVQQSVAAQTENALQATALAQTICRQVDAVVQLSPRLKQDMKKHASSSSSSSNNNNKNSSSSLTSASLGETELQKLGLAICDAVAASDACADGQHQLLAAVSGPRDLLIPPAQQKLPPDCRPTRQLEAALLHYIHHRPPSTLPSPATQPHETPQTGLRAPQQQQLKQQQAPAQEACKPPQMQQPPRDDAQRDQGSDLLLRLLTAEPTGRSDVSALVLSSPCPVEALLDPEVWWSWQQALLKLDTCDTCGADTLQQAVLCLGCSSAVYCSSRCMQQDGAHMDMCDKLSAAQQRYSSADASRPCGSSFPGLSVLLKPRERCELGRMASPCLAEPTFTTHGNSLVPTEDFVVAAAELAVREQDHAGSRQEHRVKLEQALRRASNH